MNNWDLVLEFFADGIPFSEYIWVPLIIGVSLSALYVAKKMVSDV
jgi:hypothetical protein